MHAPVWEVCGCAHFFVNQRSELAAFSPYLGDVGFTLDCTKTYYHLDENDGLECFPEAAFLA